MIEIQITKGKVAIVDDCDGYLKTLKWHAVESHGVWYAYKKVIDKQTPMHHFIIERVLGRELNPSEEVDHVNRNGLDNRRSNLRLATKSQQKRNSSKCRFYLGRPPTSKYKGVTRDWKNKNKIWRAQITFDKRVYNLGRFSSEIDAARAYDRKAREVFGEYAKLNFPADYD